MYTMHVSELTATAIRPAPRTSRCFRKICGSEIRAIFSIATGLQRPLAGQTVIRSPAHANDE
jgi:hypothetical protein